MYVKAKIERDWLFRSLCRPDVMLEELFNKLQINCLHQNSLKKD